VQVSTPLDPLIGKLQGGMVYTIIGASGLGKTSLVCAQIPMLLYKQLEESETSHEKDRYLVVNTDYSLLPARVKQVARRLKVDYGSYREKAVYTYPETFWKQQGTVCQAIPDLVKRENYSVRYLTLDPINHHLRMEFAKASPRMRLNVVGRLSPALEHQMVSLVKIAREHEAIVLVTVIPKKKYLESKPATWQAGYFGSMEIAHLSDVVLWLNPTGFSPATVELEVVKNRIGKVGGKREYSVTEVGLE